MCGGMQRMTSLEIAEVAGKQHKDMMRAIRNMEAAWERVNGRKFALVDYRVAKRGTATLLLADEDGVPLHCHEVQRRGTGGEQGDVLRG